MKRIFIFTLTLLFSTLILAQDGKKLLKDAQKALDSYISDFSKAGELTAATDLLTQAFQDPSIASNADSWNTRGEILLNVADAQSKQRLLNPNLEITNATTAVDAVDAFEMALNKATKKGHTKDALKGLSTAEGVLNNMGIDRYQSEDYIAAYQNFAAELKASALLKAQGESSRLDAEGLLSEKYFFAGITGYYAEQYDDSASYLIKSIEEGSEEPSSYQILYEALNKSGNEEDALSYLQKGRSLYPEDSGLLFSEINHYLAKGELEKIIGNLEKALEQEPENTSVMVTIGQVYDQLSNSATQEGNDENAKLFFDQAMKHYKSALELEPDNFTANYSVGALHYNKAASYTPALNEAAEDFSAAGNKRYEEVQKKMAEQFDMALPYFLKADELNNVDYNTLIALKEIYVRKDMLDKSNEYKSRIEELDKQ